MNKNYNSKVKDQTNIYNYCFDDKMNEFKIKKLKELINFKNIKNVLEVGCFEGGMTKLLNENFENVDILEPSTDCISKMKSLGYKNKFINDIIENYNTNIKYDLIIISHTLEHIEDRNKALNKAASFLSLNGYLYVVVPNGTSISRLIAHKLNLLPYPCCVTNGEKEHGHYITYDLYSLERDARKTNLDIIEKGGIILKIFGNAQYDKAMEHNIIDDNFLNACYKLGNERPMDCSSIYFLGQKI